MKSLFILFSTIILISCGHDKNHHHHHDDQKESHEHTNEPQGHHHGHANAHMHQMNFEDLVQRFESEERAAYQKPEEVVQYLGELQGMTIMEIGAGTGYFSFRLVDAGAKIIAADVDERFQAYIKNKRDSLAISDKQLALRQVPYDDPKLEEEEVDMVLVVNTYHHIEAREKYFKNVLKGLKDGGRLVVIDFFKKDTPVGPPVEMKLSSDEVKSELSIAGFNSFEINEELLPYQYIVTARK